MAKVVFTQLVVALVDVAATSSRAPKLARFLAQ
jgi:hypothetical protein